MNATWLILKRELGAYVRSPLGSVIIAVSLLVDGIFFYTQSLSERLLSGEALQRFFYNASGVTTVAALVLSFRLIAEERQTKTFTLLNTSPVSDREIVLGKFFSAFCMVALLTLLSVYMPLMLFVNGKVSVGHILVGYLGLLLIGAAATAIGLFASALTRYQVLAAIVGAVIIGVMFVFWMLAKVADPPISDFVAAMSFHHVNFQPFQFGILELRGVAYYVAVTYFFLLAATKVLEARRWR
ncbi:MAG TPA: ABC transporter permease [Polyangiaceae bacterium]|jgi:ABC-2 type transport system permease protein|nr:ABC transporter permease [Polyangiaceae bacterium]